MEDIADLLCSSPSMPFVRFNVFLMDCRLVKSSQGSIFSKNSITIAEFYSYRYPYQLFFSMMKIVDLAKPPFVITE